MRRSLQSKGEVNQESTFFKGVAQFVNLFCLFRAWQGHRSEYFGDAGSGHTLRLAQAVQLDHG